VKPQLRAFSGVMCVEMVANIGPTVSIQRGGGDSRAHRLLRREPTWEDLKSGLLTREDEWRHLASLCEKEYRGRLWIIQEVF
jgi:hypothetical protein